MPVTSITGDLNDHFTRSSRNEDLQGIKPVSLHPCAVRLLALRYCSIRRAWFHYLINSFSVALTYWLLFLHRKQVVSAMSSLASMLFFANPGSPSR
jgi:hypothetical protein